MKVLFICKADLSVPTHLTSFNNEFVESQRNLGADVDVLILYGKALSYLKFISTVRKKLRENKYDVVHASYALSGLTICFQKKTPSIVTFLGSDINNNVVRFISKHIVIQRIDAAVFVSKALYIKAGQPSKAEVIPLGVNFKKFYPKDKAKCREELGMSDDVKYILFSARFDRAVKNAPLAFKAIEKVQKHKLELVELKNIPDDKMNTLFNACDICLMTSISEGSPQFIKEAMACNKPIVSTNVGDVEWIFGETPGHFITTYEPDKVAESIIRAVDFLGQNSATRGRKRLEELNIDIDAATKRNMDIYHKIITKN